MNVATVNIFTTDNHQERRRTRRLRTECVASVNLSSSLANIFGKEKYCTWDSKILFIVRNYRLR